MINHLPIFGSLIGGFVVVYGLVSKSSETKLAAYYVVVLSAVGAIIAYMTGEAAEGTVEHLQGISKSMLEQHEDASVFALVALIILGIASLIGAILTIKKSTYSKSVAMVILFIALISFGIIARTGHLGGQIRHTELSNTTPAHNDNEHHDHD